MRRIVLLLTLYFGLSGGWVSSAGISECVTKYHYEFTECDEFGGRWIVNVPDYTGDNVCDNVAPEVPKRIKDCSISCGPGSYFNLTALKCTKCPAGTYSLGGGISFDAWDRLPPELVVSSESFTSSFSGRKDSKLENCSKYGWTANGQFLACRGGPCVSTLALTVKLVKPGLLNYTYQYVDDALIFEFEAQNAQCQSISNADEYKWPLLTEEGKWGSVAVELKSGLNVLHWKVIGMDSHKSKPVLIKRIQVNGVAYTSSCTKCRPGTSSQEGSQECIPCPVDYKSGPGASHCLPCDKNAQYSPFASSECIDRPPCQSKDFYQMHTDCNEHNKTTLLFKWIEPKICRDDLPEAVILPNSGRIEDCPPCNPGMEYKVDDSSESACQFCPRGQFSDGIAVCSPCPPGTTPNYGFEFKWWSSLPPGMTRTCIGLEERRCGSEEGWQLARDHIHSGRGHLDGAYLVLSLKVGGFRGREGIVNGQPEELGQVSFTFELVCQAACEFVFMQATKSKGVSVIRTWEGAQPRQHYVLKVTQNDSYTFTWAFQKVSWDQGLSSVLTGTSRMFENDMAKLYTINVTNTLDGGAKGCLNCPMQGDDSEIQKECIPCPNGHYIQENSSRCLPCPPNTVVTSPLPYGIKSCHPCGPGLSSTNGYTCNTNCIFQEGDSTYDLRKLQGTQLVKGALLFTASGTQYYHLFNLSLCGDPQVTCQNNVTYRTLSDVDPWVTSLVCRSTMVPSRYPTEPLTLSTQSMPLGDHLIGVTRSTHLGGIKVMEEFKSKNSTDDLHFYFSTPMSTPSCPDGRSTTITLRCDPSMKGNGLLTLPVKCPDGTCDGCSFHFLWKTMYACRRCSMGDYKAVKGECVGGTQDIHYLPPGDCLMPDEMPPSKSIKCLTEIPFYIKVIIISAITLGFILCLVMASLWKKNKKLRYKYMKLVQNSSGKEGELPAAESCALQDGDDDDEEVQFSQKKSSHGIKQGIFNRMQGLGTKGHDRSAFETLHLTENETFS